MFIYGLTNTSKPLPKGKGHRFTEKEDKQAKKIAEQYRSIGYTEKDAKRIGYARVNKLRKR